MAKDQTTEQRDWFFQYFRCRREKAEQVDDQTPEFNVLVAAGIDALASYWERTFPEKSKGPRAAKRMAVFLSEHGPDPWKRVSAPDLLRRAKEEEFPELEPGISQYLGREGPEGSVRTWEHDPTWAEIEKDAELVRKARAGWFSQGRYGEIFYRDFRCMWLHELRLANHMAEANGHARQADSPRYQNYAEWDPVLERSGPEEKRLIFSKKFLLRTYEAAIESFLKACKEAGDTGIAPRVD